MRLGIRVNLAQFSLLVGVNALVGEQFLDAVMSQLVVGGAAYDTRGERVQAKK